MLRPGLEARAACRLAQSGAIQSREDVLDGFERVPEAFLRKMAGRNFGG